MRQAPVLLCLPMEVKVARSLLPLSLLFLVSCGQDLSITSVSKCDGVASRDEKSVDEPFDRDGDGYFDGNNPDCAETYPADQLDCDDIDADVHPGAEEVLCDGNDNDCNPVDTPDSVDRDMDTFDSCEDCDDTNNTISPNGVEVSCDGIDNDCDEATLDGTDDADQDRYTSCEDCDDHNSAVNPNRTEVDCNGLDDDCNEATPDGDDLDGDGFDECDDCDDLEGQVFPGRDEICDDGLDNNCNGRTDEDCSSTYTDTWTLDQTVNYSCAFGSVAINFNQVTVLDNNPAITFVSMTGQQPGSMSGTLTNNVDFDVNRSIAGTCTEVYRFVGTFSSDTTFTGTFTAAFQGGQWCFDCRAQTWTVNGTR